MTWGRGYNKKKTTGEIGGGVGSEFDIFAVTSFLNGAVHYIVS